MRTVSDKNFTDTQNTHFTPNNALENRDVYKTRRKKQSRAWQAIDNNKAHAHCMLDT